MNEEALQYRLRVPMAAPSLIRHSSKARGAFLQAFVAKMENVYASNMFVLG